MKRIGKWCLSVLLAVTLAMPAMAAQPVSSTEAGVIEVQAEESAAETDESQTETKETETSQPETKETESETKETETSQPETKETETESESETETETEAPVDPVKELIDQVTASKPVLTSAKCTGFQLTVSWKKVSGYTPDGYYLYRKTGNEDWKRIATLGADKTSYTDTKAKYGTSYTYTLRAYKKIEGKDYRSGYDKKGVSAKVSPAAPKLTATVKSYKSAVISWSKVNGADEYAVYVKNASTGKWSRKTTVKGTSYTASATCGQSYTYTVRALKKQDGKTVMSAYDKNGVTFKTKLTAPVLKKAVSKQYNQINISWEKVDGAQKYYVYRKTANSGYKQIGTTEELNFTDSKVSCGSTYTYTVRAYRVQGDIKYTSGYDKDGKTATAVPATPVLKTISGSDYEKINVKWNAVSGADTYYVYRKLPGGKWSRIGSTSGNSKVSFVDRTAEPYQVYMYTVRAARTVNGKKVMSGYDKTGTYWVDYPTLANALATDGEIDIAWDEIQGADGYRIYRKTGNGSWSRIATVKGQSNTEFTDTSCKKGTKYGYTVRAYCTAGDKTFLSDYDRVGESTVWLDLQLKKLEFETDFDDVVGFKLTVKNNTGKTITFSDALYIDIDPETNARNGCTFELYNSSGDIVDSVKVGNGKTSTLNYHYYAGDTPVYYNQSHWNVVAAIITYDGNDYLYQAHDSVWSISSTEYADKQ